MGELGTRDAEYPTLQSSRRIVGRYEAETLGGSKLVENIARLEKIHPALSRHILEDGFGATTSSGLDQRETALLVLGVLTAIGDCADQLEVYLDAALLHGASEAEILSVITLTSSFVGNPRAVNSVRRISDKLISARRCPELNLREIVVALSDHETLVRDSGGVGVPIVLIHALSMDGSMFQELVPRLCSAGARVITYDLRGHGRARGAPLTMSLEHLVDDLRLLLEKLRLEEVDLVGASYGGAVAQYFALANPRQVRSLCPMATGAEGHPFLATRATRAENGEMPSLRTEAIIRWFTPESIANNTWCVRLARSQLARARTPEWAAAWRAMAGLNCLHRIKDIKCPILVLAGGKDLSATPDIMRRIQNAAEEASLDCQYVEIKEGTHMMAMEFPGEVAQVLLNFRTKVEEGSRNLVR